MNNNTSRIEEIIKSSYSQNITVVGQQRKAYDIADETKNAYEITLPPVGFLDFLKGRENELQEVKDMLLQNGKIVIVNGIGGIGKTTLCKYLFKHSKELFGKQYDHIAWVRYQNNIESSFINSFRRLNIPFLDSDSNKEKFERIIYELNQFGDRLLIFIDNVDRIRKQDRGLVNLLQLKSHIIITSRMKIYDEDFLYPLGFLEGEACKEIFLKYYRYDYEKRQKEIEVYLAEIIRLCGNHALTIELLSKTINQDEITLREAISLMKKEKFDLSSFCNRVTTGWDDRENERIVNEHIKKVFSISKLSQNQKETLMRLALLAPMELDVDRAKALLHIDNNQIEIISKKGWIANDGQSIQMHRVVKYAINEQRMSSISKYKFILSNMSHMLVWKEKYSELDLLIPHAEEIYERFCRISSDDLGDLLQRMVDYFKYQGDMRLVIKYLKRKITFLNKRNHRDKEIATDKKMIAAIYLEIGQPYRALPFLVEALHMRKRHHVRNSLEIAECYANIGYLYQEIGEYTKTLNNYKKALEIRIEVDGVDGKITAWSYNNLAMTYALLYDYKNAIHYIDKAINIRKNVANKAVDRKDQALTDVAQSTNIKGYILLMKGDYENALWILEESLKIRERYLGKDNIVIATSKQRYAQALCMNNRLNDAYDHIKAAIDIYIDKIGENTGDMALAYNTYGIIERYNNHIINAERLHLKAINIYSKLNSSKDPRMLQLYEDLADTYQYFGENTEAACYYGKALEVGQDFLREDNWKLKELEEKRRMLRAGF